jgi:vacuolar-type H+-ATPase catalytic subunit A/Vma1
MKSIQAVLDWSILQIERKSRQTLSYIEKQFSEIVANMTKEKLITLVEFNIQYYQKQLALIDQEIKTAKPQQEIVPVKGEVNSQSSDEYSESISSSER